MKKILFLVLFCSLLIPVSAIQINEILANPASDWNGNGLNDTYADEWVELYNPSDSTKDLTNWTLGDKVKNYTISDISLCSKCFLVLYGSNTSLKLNNQDEEIFLYNESKNLVDNFTYSSSSADVSIGRCPDGGNWSFDLFPTPDTENNCSTKNETEENITELTITSKPDNVIFGGNYELSINFNPANYDYENIKFIIYGSHERVIANSAGEKITSYASCQGSYAINVNKSQNYSFTFPFFIYPNCDDDYSNGTYEIALRACRPSGSGYTKYLEEFFNLSIAGKNSTLCADDQEDSNDESDNTTSSEEVDVEILNAPTTAVQGEMITIKVDITNNFNSSKSMQIYSYAYRGTSLATEGGWTANKKEFTLDADNTETIKLTNKIKPDAELGTYILKVRLKVDKKEIDTTQDIEILEGEISFEEGEVEYAEKAETNETKTPPITGAVVWFNEKSNNFTTLVLLFCFILLIFVITLIRRN